MSALDITAGEARPVNVIVKIESEIKFIPYARMWNFQQINLLIKGKYLTLLFIHLNYWHLIY